MMAVSFLLVFFVKIPVDSFLLSMIKTRVDWGVRVKGVGVRKPWKKHSLTLRRSCNSQQFSNSLEGPHPANTAELTIGTEGICLLQCGKSNFQLNKSTTR